MSEWTNVVTKITDGCLVRLMDAEGVEKIGHLSGDAAVADGRIRMKVFWSDKDADTEPRSVVMPISARSCRSFGSSVLIGSTDQFWIFSPTTT